jgi:ketosteroid isomerase-like protein
MGSIRTEPNLSESHEIFPRNEGVPGSNPGVGFLRTAILVTVSGKNLEIVRRSLERWSDGDLEGFIGSLDPEIEWRTSGIYPDVDPVYYGHDGFRKFWRDFHEIWDTLSMELGDAVVAGDQIAFSFHFDATGRDGVRAGRDQASLVTLRNGLLLRIENYSSWDEALGRSIRTARGQRLTSGARPPATASSFPPRSAGLPRSPGPRDPGARSRCRALGRGPAARAARS